MLLSIIYQILALFLLTIANQADLVRVNSPQRHALSPYCYTQKNVTEMKMVTKTRTKTVKTKVFGIFPHNKKFLELYNEEVPVVKTQLIRHCCEGYEMDELKLKCKPICAAGCPENAHCEQPEHCSCDIDYIAISQHPNLECGMEQEQHIASTTEPADNESDFSTQQIEQSSTFDEEWQLSSSLQPVSRFRVQLNYDCQRNQCPEYATCLANGTCVCLPGYQWHEESLQLTNEQTLTQETYCLPINESLPDNSWNYLLIVVLLGVASAIMLIVVQMLRLCKKRKGNMPVATAQNGEQNALCKYVNKEQESSACLVY